MPPELTCPPVKGAFLAVAVSTYVDGFGTGIVGIDLQLPNKKAKTVIKIWGLKISWFVNFN